MEIINNRLFGKYFLVAVGLIYLTSCSLKEEQKPNILFIMSDDHTTQAWGTYGGILKDYVKTPNIRRLAEEGVLLENCFTTNSLCTPSRASIVTGQYSHINGVYALRDTLNPEGPSVARLLQSGGYETAMVGKWHLKSKPTGFDYFNILPGQGHHNNPTLKNRDNWDEGGEKFIGFCDDIIADQAINWLNQRKSDDPFFMMCHFKATHLPFDYPDRHEELYKWETIPEPATLFDFSTDYVGRKIDFIGEKMEQHTRANLGNINTFPGLPFSPVGLDSAEYRDSVYQKFIKDYMRGVAAVDENIGRLLDVLKQKGLDENTVVIYTSDQGFFLGEHGLIDKRMMYEESLRMPFVVRYPAEIPAGKRVDDIILNIDFPSLFLDYAGVDQPGYMQGASFRQNLTGKTPANWRKSMYYRYWLHTPVYQANFGIRNERYKLIFYYGLPLDVEGADTEVTSSKWEFFDLKNDPMELVNLYSKTNYSEIIDEMKNELLALKKQTGDLDEDHPELLKLIRENW